MGWFSDIFRGTERENWLGIGYSYFCLFFTSYFVGTTLLLDPVLLEIRCYFSILKICC